MPVETVPCKICQTPHYDFPYEGHSLCPHCVLTACGRCWKAILQQKIGWIHLRWVCSGCGWKSKPL